MSKLIDDAKTYSLLGARFEVYENGPLKQNHEPDFLCFGKIIIKIKATNDLTNQVITYLKATGMKLRRLINFGKYPKIQHERFVSVNH